MKQLLPDDKGEPAYKIYAVSDIPAPITIQIPGERMAAAIGEPSMRGVSTKLSKEPQ
jgi:hypothetical protein